MIDIDMDYLDYILDIFHWIISHGVNTGLDLHWNLGDLIVHKYFPQGIIQADIYWCNPDPVECADLPSTS